MLVLTVPLNVKAMAGILNLDLPFEHIRAGSSLERESTIGIPVHNCFVHQYTQVPFDVIFA